MKAPWRRLLDIHIQTVLGRQDWSGVLGNQGDVLGFNNGKWGPVPISSPPQASAVGLALVYQPTPIVTPPAGNCYHSEAQLRVALAALLASTCGPVTLAVDSSLVPFATLNGGPLPGDGRVWITSARDKSTFGGGTPDTLNIANGSSLQDFAGVLQGSTLQINCTCVSAPGLSFTTANPGFLDNDSVISNAGGAPLISLTAGQTLELTIDGTGAMKQTGGGPIVDVPAGATLVTVCYPSQANGESNFVGPSVVTGAGTWLEIRAAASGKAMAPTFAGARSIFLTSDANTVQFLDPTTIPAAVPALGPTTSQVAQQMGLSLVINSPTPVYTVDTEIVAGGEIDGEIISGIVGSDFHLPPAADHPGRQLTFTDITGANGAILFTLTPQIGDSIGLSAPGVAVPISDSQARSVTIKSASATGANRWDLIASTLLSKTTAPGLSQTTWFIDPQKTLVTSSDTNDGLTAATALVTIREMARRLGTTQPEFASPTFTTVVTLLSDTNAADPWDFRPIVGTIVLKGTLAQQQVGQFNAFTPRNQAAGTKASGGTASFLSWVAFVGMLVQDTTLAPNAWFTVDADTGGGTATFTQPESDPRSNVGAVIPSMLTPGAGDNFTIWRPSIVHMTQTGALGVNAQVILQNGTGTPVNANGQVNLYGGIVAQLFPFNVYVTATAQNEGNDAAGGGISNGKPFFAGCALLKGCEMESHAVYGGSIASPFVLRAAGVQAIYGGGVLFNAPAGLQSFSSPGKHQFGDCGFFCTNLNLLGAGNGRQGSGVVDTGTDATPAGATPAVWGPSTWPIKSGGIHMARVSFTLELKVTGNVTLAGAANGFGFVDATGLYTVGPTVVLGAQPAAAAAIDAALGVFNPRHMCGMFVEA